MACARFARWVWLLVVVVGLVLACGGPSVDGAPTVVEFFRVADSPIERGAEVDLEWSVTAPGMREGVDSCALLRQVEGEAWGTPVGVACVGTHSEVPPSPPSASSVSYRLRVVKQPADAADPFVTRDVSVEFVVPSVAIDPASVSMGSGESLEFTASVSGAVDASVTWSASGGSIEGSGSTVTYTAPMEAGSFTVTATSVADPSVSASASILVAGVEVSIDPPSASVLVSGRVEFYASVLGTSDTGVSWTASCGSISGLGSSVTFVAPDFTGSCTVTAVSTADPSASASAVVAVGEVAVAIAPTSVSLDQGESRTFTATVTGADDPSVSWGASGGSISESGMSATYTAPMEAGSFTVTATSIEDASASASATVTVPEIIVAIVPESVTMLTDETVQFSASVSGAADASVLWSASAGSISGSGNSVTYAAPGVAGTFSVTASSVAEPNESASARVVVELVAISIDPVSAEVFTGETTTFTATVTGTGDARVSWGASCGSISGSGSSITFVAPDFAGPCTVTATSLRDPRRTASATVVVEAPPTGDLLWTRLLGSDGDELVTDVWLDDDGSVIIVGTTTGNVGGRQSVASETDVFLAKYDPDGFLADVRQYYGPTADRPMFVRPQGDGSLLIGGASFGETGDPPVPEGSLWLRVVDEDFDLYMRDEYFEFGTTEDAGNARAMTVDSRGNVIVAGTVLGDRNPDALLMKFDPYGNLMWSRQLSLHIGGASRVAVNSEDQIVIAGPTYKSSFVAVYDGDGTLDWSVIFGGQYFGDVAIDRSGDVFVALTDGYGRGMRGLPPVAYLVRCGSDGSEIWRQSMGNASGTRAGAVELGSKGTVVVAGRTGSYYIGDPDGGLFVAKYEGNGNRLWVQQFSPDHGSPDEMHLESPSSHEMHLAVNEEGASALGATVRWRVRVDDDSGWEATDYDVATSLLSP